MTETTRSSERKIKIGASELLYVAICAVAIVYALSAYVPLLQDDVGSNLDWLIALTIGRQRRLPFGREMMFTYGPLGGALTGYFPGVMGLMVAIWSAIALLTWFAIWVGLRRSHAPRWLQIAGPFVLSMLVTGEHPSMLDTRFFLLPPLMLAYHFWLDDRPVSAGKTFLVLALAISGLLKFTYLVSALIACGAVSVDEVLRARKPISVIALVILYGLGWILAGQSPVNLPAYLSASLDVTRGYGQAMALWTATEGRDIACFVSVALALLLLIWFSFRTQPRWRRSLHSVSMLALLFIIFKAGYVRHDAHEILATSTLAAGAALYLIANHRAIGTNLASVAWLLCVAGAVTLASHSCSVFEEQNIVTRTGRSFSLAADEVGEAIRIMRGNQPRIAAKIQSFADDASQSNSIPHLPGSTDLYTQWTREVMLSGMDYHPRPAIQSYAAYTPWLAAADADHLRGDRAPQNILFSAQTIDQRLASMEDGPSWIEIMSRYNLVATGKYLIFQRANVPRRYTKTVLLDAQRPLDASVDVPKISSGIIFAQIKLHPTMWGEFISAIYKPPALVIEMTIEGDDAKPARRFVPGMGEAGFILSPFIYNDESFAYLCNASIPRRQPSVMVKAFRILGLYGKPPAPAWGVSYDVTLYQIDFASVPPAR